MSFRKVYEASDINLDNPIHGTVHNNLLASNIVFTFSTGRLKGLDSVELETEMKKNTAIFLTGLAEKGIELVLQEESIPKIFREGTD